MECRMSRFDGFDVPFDSPWCIDACWDELRHQTLPARKEIASSKSKQSEERQKERGAWACWMVARELRGCVRRIPFVDSCSRSREDYDGTSVPAFVVDRDDHMMLPCFR